jgi:hypothetical protein
LGLGSSDDWTCNVPCESLTCPPTSPRDVQ